MPRVSLRKGLLYVVTVTICSFLLLSVHHPGTGWLSVTGPRAIQSPSRNPSNHPVLMQLLNHGGDTGEHDEDKSKEAIDLGENGGEDDLEIKDPSLRLPPLEQEVPLEPGIPLPPLVNNFTKPSPEKLPWYLRNGLLRPTTPPDSETFERKQKLWPDEEEGDRILGQLMFKPPLPPTEEDEHPDVGGEISPLSYKKILMYNGMNSWNVKAGRGAFLKLKCPVDTCVLTGSRSEASTADAIVYKDHFNPPHHQRSAHQVWIMYMLECPLHTQQFSVKNAFNWTATYRHDSDIVTPYERYVYYDQNVRQKMQDTNYAANKTKQVAWFVSNCGARNNRLNYAKELGKYINVDIYGACGTHRCPRSNAAKCFEMLDAEYKFYLAFENSNCRDYITEKFFVNGLRGHPAQKTAYNILPIVMGAHPDDYKRAAPERSYIHVDDFQSPKHLAQYLRLLDKNDNLYNEYFRWKGTGEFINTYFFCRLCAMVHDDHHKQHYDDINMWWRGSGTCINGSWRKTALRKSKNYMIGNKTKSTF